VTLRVLVIMPSWVGDAVMATPALRRVRDVLRGSLIGGLVRPGIDEVMAGTGFFDEVEVDRPRGVMGHKHLASRLRQRRYGAALLLTNSFSTALTARLAGIPRRIGYSRDGRGVLLTERLHAPKRGDGRWAPIPALLYYWRLAGALLGETGDGVMEGSLPAGARLELATTAGERSSAEAILSRAGVGPDRPYAVLNPGGNNPAKRWPPERFAALAGHLSERHGLSVLVNGSPGEAALVSEVASRAGGVSLPEHGITLGGLKGLLARATARLMVTNDTGPRHLAAAFGVPVVTLFGPTDPRWTTIPAPAGERVLVADPALPWSEVADDHPERCRIERITLEEAVAAADGLLASRPFKDS
jgi:heptosyltransferase-2